MRSSSIPSVLPALLLAAPLVSAHTSADSVVGSLFARADDGYENTVCRPPVKEGSDNTIPPCSSIENIEYQCAPNGTSPLALEAHKQCMCGGSFFTEWPFCQQCLYVHGLRSERDVKRYTEVLSSVEAILCNARATPTAIFADIFTSVAYQVPEPTDGATISSDQAVSKTDVSYYMTTTISQGPGKITGSALSATATDAPLAPQTTNTGGDGGANNDGETTSTTRGPFTVTTSSSASGASSVATETSSKHNGAAGIKADITGVFGVAAAMAVAVILLAE
ncbi:hypothetical protein GE21DRAFT_7861 [Neurospora crassa]|uniref:Uncharacterized protein n=2 Tax=Neurospora crassa TaxID=5141 RepID=Q1K6L6_NEUCR|nr:hypothetical protein NCU01425 [Neurospora crassa OR74A]EAA31457.1 hypothetical protein NCU01425 [Neurospora crassa OR74A]KHE86897.1 hypothetical protein GE21DRAFT_7861 [Neurospora crassa]CAD70870.1 conserved hypothetical protein [Neurospora crassa]|eukprot:XP_960693.1 hypothetical protein NCU01425 [Neurospora crassa OR74A]